MQKEFFTDKAPGRLVPTIDDNLAFVPDPLPPKNFAWSDSLISLLSEADRSLGQVEGLGVILPNPDLFILPFAHREAVLSSRIEGTQSSLSDLVLFEGARIERHKDVREVSNYLRALHHGLEMLHKIPLASRLICECHSILLEGVRGSGHTTGEFRKSQNYIAPPGTPMAKATYIPPPPDEVPEAMSQLEKFIHSDNKFPPLIEAAFLHYQFEAIHPFMDGNGRIGRLLIILFLLSKGILTRPLFYPSAYYEKNRQEYYDRLLAVSTHGEWEEWAKFFLNGVVEQSRDAIMRAQSLFNIQQSYYKRVEKCRVAGNLRRVIDLALQHPILIVPRVKEALGVSFPAAQRYVSQLVEYEILKEVTISPRKHYYIAQDIIDLLSKESV
jgi:Fic family protein